MENQAEEYILALQTTKAVKQKELTSLSGWHFLRRRRLRGEIRQLDEELQPLLRQAQGIRQ